MNSARQVVTEKVRRSRSNESIGDLVDVREVAPSPLADRPTPAVRQVAAPARESGRGRLWRSGVQPGLVVSDLVAVAVGLVLVGAGLNLGAVAAHVGVVVMLAGLGTYRSRLTLSVFDDLPALVAAAVVGAASERLVRVLLGPEVSQQKFLWQVIAVAGLLTLTRTVAYLVVREARRRGLVAHRVLILGVGDVGRQVAAAALEHPEYGLRPVGFLDADPGPDESLPVPLLGTYADLASRIRELRVSEVIVAFGNDDDVLVEALSTCDRLDCEIFCVPRFFELHHRTRDMDEIRGISLVRVRRATWRSPAWRVKRLLDLVMAVGLLAVLGPLMLAIAAAVRSEVGRGVLFRQVRVGLDGVPFTLLKFRSLRLPEGPDAPAVWSINGDARIGPVGRFLRATSLDELPQLINVIKGEMSIVGPRPERQVFVDEFAHAIPRYTARHRAPAGLTGWAQVNGLRGDTSIEERARFDNYYIQNWSLWLDAKILARTVGTVLFRRGS